MRRTSPECGTTPPSRFLQALLLLLFVAVALPDCSAALINTNTSSVLTRNGRTDSVEEGDVNYQKSGIYPAVILFNIHGKYHVRVDNPLNTDTSKYKVTIFRQWKTIVKESVSSNRAYKLFRFDNLRSTESGRMLVRIAAEEPWYVEVLQHFEERLCMPFEDTEATMTANFRYYGFPITVSAKLPAGSTPTAYRLLPPSKNCLDVADCDALKGCHKIQKSDVLPPPGTYNLCVTANGWESRYLPWGHSSLDVTALVSKPLTLFVGRLPTITLFEAHTGRTADGSEKWRSVLVRCSGDNCPTVKDLKGAEIIDVSACNANAINGGAIISATQLKAPPGVYALCVLDDDSYASPAAFSVRVVDAPFSMTVIESSDVSVDLEVSGGDIGDRKEPYIICIAENNSLCSTVTPSDDKCTTAADPNSKVVSVDVSSVARKDRMTFCLISRSVSYSTALYVDLVGELKYEGPITPIMSLWVLIAIVAASIVLLSVIVGIIVCCVRKNNNDEKSYFGENWSYKSGMGSSAYSLSQNGFGGGYGSAYGGQFPSGYMPPAYASTHSLMEMPQEEMMLRSGHGSWMQH